VESAWTDRLWRLHVCPLRVPADWGGGVLKLIRMGVGEHNEIDPHHS
jgi:hypothetical protein